MQRIYGVVVGAKSLRLINDCEMVFIDTRLQPVYTVVLECPGKDSIRLSPLPVVETWVERRKATLYLQVGYTIKHPLNYEGVLGDFLEWSDDFLSAISPADLWGKCGVVSSCGQQCAAFIPPPAGRDTESCC